MLTLLTPTKNRPQHFARLEECVKAQRDAPPYRWIVVNDGSEPYAYNMGQEVILRDPSGDKRHSLCENLLAGLSLAETSPLSAKLLIIEDDDYYAPDYLAVMARYLDVVPLAGLVPARYYHTVSRRFRVLHNYHYASLASTGMRRAVWEVLRLGCRIGQPFVDGFLWTHWASTLQQPAGLFTARLHVGLKDGSGIGIGHDATLGEPDPDGKVLHSWIGDSANDYL